jgi:putative transposase
MADIDSAFCKQVFHIPQAQRKAHIHHHDQADDFRRRVEIPEWARWFLGSGHPTTLADHASFASRCICSDSTLQEFDLAARHEIGDWTIEVIKRSHRAQGFVILPRRWVVERTFAWLNPNRRLAKDFEQSIASATAWIFMASVQLLTRRIARS